jgi:hypothetical protein
MGKFDAGSASSTDGGTTFMGDGGTQVSTEAWGGD